ncbi:MAG: hypothetical protein LBS52_02435, partial [Dysgonamonadaceae bacterium]|nr:hypothetical protein [Dysgonamonadaceae bacterium]
MKKKLALMRKLLPFTVLAMVFVAVLCDKNDEGALGKGKVALNFNACSIAAYQDDAETRGGTTAVKQVVEALPFNGDFPMEATLERVREPQTRATFMANGTKIQLFVYESPSGNFVGTTTLTVGPTAQATDVLLDVGKRYVFKALSYNSTTAPPSVTSPANAGLNQNPGVAVASAPADLMYAMETTADE